RRSVEGTGVRRYSSRTRCSSRSSRSSSTEVLLERDPKLLTRPHQPHFEGRHARLQDFGQRFVVQALAVLEQHQLTTGRIERRERHLQRVLKFMVFLVVDRGDLLDASQMRALPRVPAEPTGAGGATPVDQDAKQPGAEASLLLESPDRLPGSDE